LYANNVLNSLVFLSHGYSTIPLKRTVILSRLVIQRKTEVHKEKANKKENYFSLIRTITKKLKRKQK